MVAKDTSSGRSAATVPLTGVAGHEADGRAEHAGAEPGKALGRTCAVRWRRRLSGSWPQRSMAGVLHLAGAVGEERRAGDGPDARSQVSPGVSSPSG